MKAPKKVNRKIDKYSVVKTLHDGTDVNIKSVTRAIFLEWTRKMHDPEATDTDSYEDGVIQELYSEDIYNKLSSNARDFSRIAQATYHYSNGARLEVIEDL